MEELLYVLLEVVGDIVVGALGLLGELLLVIWCEFFVAVVARGLVSRVKSLEWRSPILVLPLYAGIGSLLGWLSSFVLDHFVIKHVAAQIANLIVTPLCVGGLMALIGRLRRERGQEIVRLDLFGYGYVFALAFVLSRWLSV